MEKITIYSLSKNGKIHFIGHTKNPILREHEVNRNSVGSVLFEVLEICNKEQLVESKNGWIRQLAGYGHPIRNKGIFPSNWIYHRTMAKDIPIELLHEVSFKVN